MELNNNEAQCQPMTDGSPGSGRVTRTAAHVAEKDRPEMEFMQKLRYSVSISALLCLLIPVKLIELMAVKVKLCLRPSCNRHVLRSMETPDLSRMQIFVLMFKGLRRRPCP